MSRKRPLGWSHDIRRYSSYWTGCHEDIHPIVVTKISAGLDVTKTSTVLESRTLLLDWMSRKHSQDWVITIMTERCQDVVENLQLAQTDVILNRFLTTHVLTNATGSLRHHQAAEKGETDVRYKHVRTEANILNAATSLFLWSSEHLFKIKS